MNSNPENRPQTPATKEVNPGIVPIEDGGERPTSEDVPSIQEYGSHGESIDTGEITKITPDTSGELILADDERGPFQEKLTAQREYHEQRNSLPLITESQPEKKSNKKLLTWIGAAATGVVLTGGAIFAANTGAEKNVTPAPVETSVSANPNPTQSAEVKPGITAEDFKFYAGDGEEFQTFEDIQKSVEFKVKDIPAPTDTIDLVVERMEKAANYLPSEKTVRASLNKPTEQLTADDYMLVFEQYLSAHDVMFSNTSGDFYETLKAASLQAGYDHLISVAEGDEIPYAVKFTLHTNDTSLLISDNSAQNKVGDGALDQLGDYRLLSTGGNDVTSKNGNWYVSGNIKMLKKGQ